MNPVEVRDEILAHFVPKVCYNTRKNKTFLKWENGPYSVEVCIPGAKIGKRAKALPQIVSNYRRLKGREMAGYTRTDEYTLETLKERLRELDIK